MSSHRTGTDSDDYENQYEDEESIVENERAEITRLQPGGHVPLNELLKLYSKNMPKMTKDIMNNNSDSFSSSEIEDDDEEEDDDDDDQRHYLLHTNGELLPINEDDDDNLYEPEIVKVINVGEEYQAEINSKAEYGPLNKNVDDREVPVDELLWSSCSLNDINDENVDEYLKNIHKEYPSSDDEISLQTLLNSQFNTNVAIAKFRQLSVKTIYSYPVWSQTEIEKFEEGLREYGKNFYKIASFKCSNRSVREVVHFYYQWKRTERYQTFIDEQHINSLSSVSDIIGKFIEEQEQQLRSAVGVVDSSDASSFISNDFKFHTTLSSNSSISFITKQQQQELSTKRSLDRLDNDSGEPTSKKLSTSAKSSPTETTSTVIYQP